MCFCFLNIWFSIDIVVFDFNFGFFSYGLYRDYGRVGYGVRGSVLGKFVGVD